MVENHGESYSKFKQMAMYQVWSGAPIMLWNKKRGDQICRDKNHKLHSFYIIDNQNVKYSLQAPNMT